MPVRYSPPAGKMAEYPGLFLSEERERHGNIGQLRPSVAQFVGRRVNRGSVRVSFRTRGAGAMTMCLFRLSFIFRRVTGTWYAEDDFRPSGHAEKTEEFTEWVAAPRREMAEEHIRYRYGSEKDFALTKVEEHRLSAIVTETYP